MVQSVTQPRHACRFCRRPLAHTFVDLGVQPPCQRHVTPENFDRGEATYPLHAYVCDGCWLAQVPAYLAADELFDADYAYFSSFSTSWLAHCARYADAMTERFALQGKFVVELASNDGYLLRNFVRKGIRCLGVEPTANTAAAAVKQGVPTLVAFFGAATAEKVRAEHGPADLVAGKNVLAHVPDVNDFVAGVARLLAPEGVNTFEFPHLLQLIAQHQFDTIYHEHYGYLSLGAVSTVFAAHGLRVFDVDELPTHGGSLRVYACHERSEHATTPRVEALLKRERDFGLFDVATYAAFAGKVAETKAALLTFLIQQQRAGKQVVGYGAPGKGNTLLNYCGVKPDLLAYTVDRSPHKQGNFLPGSRIPIHAPEKIAETRPDYVLILPWNLRDEITQQMAHVRTWGGRFAVPIPTLTVLD